VCWDGCDDHDHVLRAINDMESVPISQKMKQSKRNKLERKEKDKKEIGGK
jgi:hypothetical protein